MPSCRSPALARAGSAKKPASKKLLRFLDDEDSGVRAAAAFGSRGMGVELERVTSALVKAIEEATAFIYSFDALAALGAGARSAALFLVEYAENEGGVSLPPLAHVAVGDRKLERKTVELARKYLRSEEGGEVSRAAEAIAVLGPAGVAALPDLRKLLREPVERDLSLYEVMRALGAIGAPAGVATEEMLAAVEAHCSYEEEVIQALGQIGPAAAKAIPWLEELLGSCDEDDPWRELLQEALRRIKGE